MTSSAIAKEFVRKVAQVSFVSFAFLLDYVPIRILQLILLLLGVLYYASEELRLKHVQIPLLGKINTFMLRPKEQSTFAYGPLTLLLGIALTMEIYTPLFTKIAIFASTIGDSVSALTGYKLPRPRLFWNKKKSVAGTLTNMISVFLCCLLLPLPPITIACVAIASGLIESLNLEYVDNLIVPLGVGAIPYFIQ